MERNRWFEEVAGFDYGALNNPEFKEDSVREEIIMPLMKALGYDYKGRYQIVRSRKLRHPFFMVGSNKYNISVFPDYILECDGVCVCTLEAKSPPVSFRLYATSSLTPVIIFQMQYLTSHFDRLNAIMGAERISLYAERSFAKDLGIHLKMLTMGISEQRFTFMDFPIYQITLVEPDNYTVDATITLDGERYCGSFDFDYAALLGLKNVLSEEILAKLREPFTGTPVRVELCGKIIQTGISCKLGEKIYENANEHYMPFRICEFIYAELK